MTDPRIQSTYRLQLTPEFGFEDVLGLVGYFAALGVTHLYLSPILTARAGSTHGYDVADPSTVSGALGGEDRLRAVGDAAAAEGLGLVVDIVPNHLGTGPDNVDWQYLLAEGSSGEGARVFDVDWHPALPGAEGKVILPVLGDQYGVVLTAGELRVVDEPDAQGRRYRIRYHDDSFPLSPESLEALERVGRIDTLMGTPGEPDTWTRLHGLLQRQHYRLVHWRIGDRVVNYRRFFAINDLAGVRQEDEHVFERTHAKIIELVTDGVVDGLRVDHPDGLRDPAGYLALLNTRTGGVWTIVEKITHPGEALRAWATAGTTGYEFCNDVLGLFVDPAAEEQFAALDAQLGGDPRSYGEQVAAAKREVLRNDLAAELFRLGRRLWSLAQQHLEVRDLDDRHCEAAVAEALVGMRVYRSYVDPQTATATDADRATIADAVGHARAVAAAPPLIIDFLASALTGDAGDSPDHLEFIARFQQLSGALMAKGVEDTAFYRYLRMAALNEVGGDPAQFGSTVEAFHDRNAARAAHQPLGMVTTATHDTKRGEDVRLRIAALTEMPQRWVRVATSLTADCPIDGPTASLLLQTMVGVWPLLSSGEVTPPLRDRLVAYARKATRESGLYTSWYDPDEEYESRVEQFVDGVLDDDAAREDLTLIAAAAAEVAMVSGLAQVVLRTLTPGVADLYQGNELWDDSLVDPDNRRPVDWDHRRRVLEEVATSDPADLWANRRDGRIKLWVLNKALCLRRDVPAAFGADGGYQRLTVGGRWAAHVVAFTRTSPAGPQVAVVVPRLPGAVMGHDACQPLGERWDDSVVGLPAGEWTDVFSGVATAGDARVAEMFTALPVAVLRRRAAD